MDANLKSLRPGDPHLIDSIVSHLKCEGIFDEFRKSCLADVDTKPAYQNLRIRVESFADDYLKLTPWRSGLNKNHLRDGLRRRIHESGLLTTGVDRIIDQIVNPKIVPFFLPKIVEIVNRLLGITNQEGSQSIGLSLADKDELSAKSVLAVAQSLLQSKDELFALPIATEINEEVTNSQKKIETKSHKDASKMKPNETKSKSSSASILKTATVSKNIKSNESIKPIAKKEVGTSKTESPKKEDEFGKKHDTKSGGLEVKKIKCDKQKPIEKPKSDGKDEMKNKTTDKIKISGKGLESKTKSIEKQKSVEEKYKSREKSGSNIITKKCDQNPEKHFSISETETSISSQPNRTLITKDDKSTGKKLNIKHKSSKTSESKSGDYKSSEKKTATESKGQTLKEKFKSHFSSRDLQKRKHEDEGSSDSKKFKRDSSSKEKSPNKLDLDDGELSDVTVSSVHTSDLSDFDDNISLSDIEDEDSGSPNQKSSKNTKAEKHHEESNFETAEEKKACLQISEDALMSSDELRTSTNARSGKNVMNINEPKREMRRHRKLNTKYTSGDFSTIFTGNYDKLSQSKSHYDREHKDIAGDTKVSQHISTGFTNLNEKCNLLGSPISDTPSEPEVLKCATDNLHSPILSSDDGLDSNGSSSRNASKYSPKPQFERKLSIKQSNRHGSSPENYSSQQSSSLSHARDEPEPTFSKKSVSKSDSRQRYDNADLYKPRPVIVNSRRRGSSSASIEKRGLLDTECVSSGGEGISPKSSSNDAGSPNLLKKSPKYNSEAHLPFNKRRRLLQN